MWLFCRGEIGVDILEIELHRTQQDYVTCSLQLR